ncbi:MAG: cytochrome c oxidase accessory protein CcoG [Alphaproteobacteria bacterium]|nr:cytochrome c oxidase accessory protein CcoG [Alphaproteobacteria bacterium]
MVAMPKRRDLEPPAAPQPPASPLYAGRLRVYPRKVSGLWRTVKWGVLAVCLALYYLVAWLRWDRGPNAPDQAFLIDMAGRRAYFLDLEIWPQEVYYITGLLILAAVGLFLATSLFGRVWCGYTCPQTVWTDIFMLVERWIEGDRNIRIRRDKGPTTATKIGLKLAKHGVWLLIAFATGGAWVWYFNDAPTVTRQFFAGEAGTGVYFFVGLFTATTYMLAGWAREQVCTYMCPWPRFQAAMLDEQSIIVTYEAWRGEPRGKHKAGDSWEGRGDCVACNQCVAVCPTGIDIRDGQQLECIGCGLCVDACNAVMAKVGRPANLIAFDTLANQKAAAAGAPRHFTVIRPRTIIYASVLAVVSLVMLAAFLMRATVEVTVLRDRAPLFVTLSDGGVRNNYTLKILNKTRDTPRYVLSVEGIGDLQAAAEGADDLVLATRPDSVATYRVHLTAPGTRLSAESTDVTFVLRDPATGATLRHRSVFIGPRLQPGERR